MSKNFIQFILKKFDFKRNNLVAEIFATKARRHKGSQRIQLKYYISVI